MSTIRVLSSDLAKIAREELNEVPERIEDDLNTLRTWINQCPYLTARTDDQFLISFLRGCKYSLEKTKHKLELFYQVRQQTPEIIRNRDTKSEHLIGMIRQGWVAHRLHVLISTITKACNYNSFGLPLPALEHSASPRIILVRPGIFDPAKYTIQDAMKVTTMMLDIMLNEDDNFIIAGQLCILDLAGVTLQHFLQYTPSFIKKMITITQDAAPGRLKGIHWINCPRGFEQVFNIFTSFMSEKNRSRVSLKFQFSTGDFWNFNFSFKLYVHNTHESLHNRIPQRLLPAGD